MPFDTLSYFFFLPVVFLVHYCTPDRFRWLMLLAASFYFYAALDAPHLIAVLLFITTITYFTGIWIAQKESPRTKQSLLLGGISANVLTLVTLKYLPFITHALNVVLNRISTGASVPVSTTIVAIGTSYFIFQAISYLIDIYYEVEKPERHFGHFALYMSFFPKLLQGPIERSGDLLPQFKIPYVFNYNNVREGMLLFAIGMLKKVVIADRLALMVNPVFDSVHAYKGLPLLLATYYYSLQIYFDFSGYTDMALGTAMMFNVSLTQNFNNPYFATSIADFWRRWHISFSRWILDYIFKPLQMSWRNLHSWGTALALLVTFAISGIWHGANYCFLIWGVLHGLYLATYVFYNNYKKFIYQRLNINAKSVVYKIVSMFFVFNLVSVSWLFFRFDHPSEPLYVMENCITGIIEILFKTSSSDMLIGKLNSYIDPNKINIVLVLTSLLVLCFMNIFNRLNSTLKYIYITSLLTYILLFGFTAGNKFIYFRF